MVLASPYFNIRQLRVSVLALQSGNPKFTSGQDSRVVDSLRFAERYASRVGRVTHGDFSDFAMVARLFPVNIEDRSGAEASAGHVAIARTVLTFLDATLAGDTVKLAALSRPVADKAAHSLIRLVYSPAAKVLDETEWVRIISTLGFDSARELLHDYQRRYPTLEIIRYAVLNRQGYAIREAGERELAVDVFRLNAEAHPTSADAYDSLADGYIAFGNIAGARFAYQQVLRLLDADKTLSGASKADYRARAETYLRTR